MKTVTRPMVRSMFVGKLTVTRPMVRSMFVGKLTVTRPMVRSMFVGKLTVIRPMVRSMFVGKLTVIRPMVRSMLVGYLSLDMVLFVWDQYLIGLDAPNYDIIPVITALTISLLRLQVLQCQTAEEISSCLKRDGNKLKKEFYMYEKFLSRSQYLLEQQTSVRFQNYPMPWNVNVPASDVESSVTRENIRLKDLLEKESRKRQEVEERYTTGMKEMKEELNQLRKLIEKDEDAKNENDNLHQPSTSYSGQ
ncbi:hypothetical protein BSL78_03038 [Apostichopus japonicus]|uniref:Uncharacterized protein n=1 Tax=Stichopus japonicus TaxID=307972 RepID=A0A2G8LIN0_STIJA|nr:hypothetical protein BSL78_03038 [Apostichopus japonicus]